MGNSPSVIDRFYKGAISQVEVEKFWNILANTHTPVSGQAQPTAGQPVA